MLAFTASPLGLSSMGPKTAAKNVHTKTQSTQDGAPPSRRLRIGLTVLGLTLLPVAGFLGTANTGYRSVPNPPGMVYLIELEEVYSPFEGYSAFVEPRFPEGIVIQSRAGIGVPTYSLCSFPGGVLTSLDSFTPELSELTWDFDGDGTSDTVKSFLDSNAEGVVEVRSGHDGSVLYSDRYGLEYESPERGFPLGDLDNDGFGELGILYPRRDRSAYDFHPHDAILGAKSWLAIVSQPLIPKAP